MAELVTLGTAKQHLKITHASEDADLQRKLSQAHAEVLHYIDQRLGSPGPDWSAEIEDWDEDTDTREFHIVAAAILKQFGGLCRDRGDDEARGAQAWEDGLAPNVARMLTRLRDPAVA